jgi:hypothetical protein
LACRVYALTVRSLNLTGLMFLNLKPIFLTASEIMVYLITILKNVVSPNRRILMLKTPDEIEKIP